MESPDQNVTKGRKLKEKNS